MVFFMTIVLFYNSVTILAQGSSRVPLARRCTFCLPVSRHGSADEEGRHEGCQGWRDEGDEGEEGEQGCQGQVRQGRRHEGLQGEDVGWLDEGPALQEQARQDRIEEGLGGGQEALRGYQGLVRCGEGGTQGVERFGLRGDQRQDVPGQGTLRQGQGHVQLLGRSCEGLGLGLSWAAAVVKATRQTI